MAIHFQPNDPLSGLDLQTVNPLPDLPNTQARFFLIGALPPEATYDPTNDPDKFVIWQCRQTVLTAMAVWADLHEAPKRWARSRVNATGDLLELSPNRGKDLNAYYDGQGLRFFQFPIPGYKTVYSGASAEVVAHELGHALLDILRPDLWASPLPEAAAFHESFGDCFALLVALTDSGIRSELRQQDPALSGTNFVESFAEDLSAGVLNKLGADHPAAEPRHARNTFQWAKPSTLPETGPPSVLSIEPHSFSRVFTGCFYDLIIQLATASHPQPSDEELDLAARTAGNLLIRAIQVAPLDDGFFERVGQSLVQIDQTQNAGQNEMAIRQAFAGHNIALGMASLTEPSDLLRGFAPEWETASGEAVALSSENQADILKNRGGQDSVTLSRSTRENLRETFKATKRVPLEVTPRIVAGHPVVHVSVPVEVPLDGLSEQLKGVVAPVRRQVFVGAQDGQASLLGTAFMEKPENIEEEVRAFVGSLVKAGKIRFSKSEHSGTQEEDTDLPTHKVTVNSRGQKVLARLRFACRTCR